MNGSIWRNWSWPKDELVRFVARPIRERFGGFWFVPDSLPSGNVINWYVAAGYERTSMTFWNVVGETESCPSLGSADPGLLNLDPRIVDAAALSPLCSPGGSTAAAFSAEMWELWSLVSACRLLRERQSNRLHEAQSLTADNKKKPCCWLRLRLRLTLQCPHL